MKIKNIAFSKCCTLAALAACILSANTWADDDDRKRLKVRGTSHAMFVRFDPLAFSQGRDVADVALSGSFEITVGHDIRTGRFTFPHLLVVNLEFPPEPEPPVFLSGGVTGASVWIFDDGVICNGPTGGEFDSSGFGLVSKVKAECTDGTRMNLKIEDVDVEPGVSVTSKIKGRLILPKHDD